MVKNCCRDLLEGLGLQQLAAERRQERPPVALLDWDRIRPALVQEMAVRQQHLNDSRSH